MAWNKITAEERVSPRPPSQRKDLNTRNIDYSSMNNNDWKEQGDRVMSMVTDLIDDPAYKPFFFKRLYTIGPTRFLDCAEIARKCGFKPGRKFVKLLNDYA